MRPSPTIYIYMHGRSLMNKVVVGKYKGRRTLGRSTHRWEESIKKDHK
jgi:hypothetical protein